MTNPALIAHLESKVAELEAVDPTTVERLSTHNQRLRNARLTLARARGSHTGAEWAALLEETGDTCVRCGAETSAPVKAHIMPVVAGGSDAIDNLMPVCRCCASARGTEAIDWLASWRETHSVKKKVNAAKKAVAASDA